MASIFHMPIMVVLTILWYLMITATMSWLRNGERPDYLGRLAFSLAFLMLVSHSMWSGSLWKIIGAAILYILMTNGRGKLRGLTSPLRLKLCSTLSSTIAGLVAVAVLSVVLYSTNLIHAAELDHPSDIRYVFLIVLATGVITGYLRKKVRKRWPEAFESTYVTEHVSNSGTTLYMDEVLLPAVLGPFFWASLAPFDFTVRSLFSFGIMVIPLLFFVTWPLYVIWAWFHTGILGWIGSINHEQLMEMQAYEVLLWDFHIQKWLGDVKITSDYKHHRYILSGMLPDLSTLKSITLRLQDIDGAEVDASSLKIDPSMEPDYRRLSAILRRGTFASRQKLASKL